ncbi:MAG: shikimate kinase I [Gammaproteobacteria bacterium GWE2_37_16]|nr:MAG: shikimate kinase I [Gammaproteobacteria bacterium GWE2_37_16]
MGGSDKKIQNVYLIGPMGAGKTSIGRQLARKLGLEFYDSDHVVEERTGASIPWIYDIEGEEGFLQREIKVIEELTKLQGVLLATGGGTVISPENRKALRANGFIVYLKTSLDDQMERVKRSKKRPLIVGAGRRAVLKNLRVEREPFYEKLADISYNTDGRPLSVVVDEILKGLQKKGILQKKEK